MTGTTDDRLEHWFEDTRGTVPAGVVALTATGAVLASNAVALDLLGCGNSEEVRLLLQPVVKRLASSPPSPSDSIAEHFELQVRGRLQARRIVGSARRLGSDPLHWLLLLRADEQIRDFDALLQHAARNQLLQRLHGAMRHDLNSPIQAASWTFDLLQRAIQQAQLPPEQRAQLDESAVTGRKELARLKESVRRFLSFAMAANGERERIDVGELAEGVQRLISSEASLFEVKMVLEPPAQPLAVDGVRGQLEQALATLMLNAFDAVSAGGAVATTVREQEGKADIVIRGSHAAAGPDDRSKANPGAGVAPVRTPVGLHAALFIARSHGGDITEQSADGLRTFRFRLPLARG